MNVKAIEEIMADYKDCQSCEKKDCLFMTCNCPKDGSIFTREAELMQAVLRIIPLDRLREICAAEREGCVVVLPCKPGAIVYTVEDGKVQEHIASDFIIEHEDGKTEVSDPGEEGWDGFMPFYGDDERCHFTREAAEAALKGASNAE